MSLPLHFPNPPGRILLIKPSAIGDVVHALPILNLLRRHWPQSHIAWMVTPACAGLLEGHPQLDQVIRFERRRFGQGWKNPRAAAGLFAFQQQLRRERFDLVIDLQGLFRSGWLAWNTRAPWRIGFQNARELAWIFYTHRVPVGSPEQHAIDRYLTLAQALGLPRGPVEYVFPASAEDPLFLSRLFPLHEPFAVLIPGTNWSTKRWPAERFASLIRPLWQQHRLRTILAGSADEAELCHSVYQAAVAQHAGVQSLPPIVNLAGKTNLRQLVSLLRQAHLVIANDSGPMHIASALGRPLVTPFGPTNPIRTGPYQRLDSVVRLNIPCSPCYSRTCSHRSCLTLLDPASILETARLQLGPPD